jgi:hypothetical protein
MHTGMLKTIFLKNVSCKLFYICFTVVFERHIDHSPVTDTIYRVFIILSIATISNTLFQ